MDKNNRNAIIASLQRKIKKLKEENNQFQNS